MPSLYPENEQESTSLVDKKMKVDNPKFYIQLPERLDSSAQDSLKKMIVQKKKEAGNETVNLDMSNVTYIGGLCLQVLLASNCPIIGVSEKIKTNFKIFGFNQFLHHFSKEK